MKNLILGYCVGLKNADIRMFYESALQSASSPTDIVIFANGDFKCENKYKYGELFFIPTTSIWQGVTKDRYRIRWALFYLTSRVLGFLSKLKSTAVSIFFGTPRHNAQSRQKFYHHPALSRYSYYLDFLKANQEKYDKVLISDVRDVYFQNDPFEALGDVYFATFLEPGGVTCSEMRNRRWIKSVYGAKIASEMADVPVVCSGVGIGKASAMLQYLESMHREITTHSVIPYSDQGIHNVLVKRGDFPVTILKNSDALTLTAGFDSDAEDYRISDNQVLSENGVPFCIIHQFDRHPELEATVMQQFSGR